MRFRTYRLLPAGSYPRVADARQGGQVHDLFGPVSKFLCHSYDKAQAGFLACLQEFAEWLVARGASDGAGNRFALPCPIEGDKVGVVWCAVRSIACCNLLGGCTACRLLATTQASRLSLFLPPPPLLVQVNGLTIRLMFNKDKNWTRALKHMLVDLKFVLKVGRMAGWGEHMLVVCV